jgi:FKBP-type peptidyl-prolyl cis-trans isomerase FklB
MPVAALLLIATSATNEFGKAFLEAKKAEEGVIELPSGVLYKVLEAGSGEAHATYEGNTRSEYDAWTAQEFSQDPRGKTYESTRGLGPSKGGKKLGNVLRPREAIKGISEVLQLVVEEDSWEVYVPSELGYGDEGNGEEVGPGDALVWKIDVRGVSGKTTPISEDRRPTVTDLSGGSEYNRLQAFERNLPILFAVLRKPVKSSKIFTAYSMAAGEMIKRGAGGRKDFMFSAQSEFMVDWDHEDGGVWTLDTLVDRLSSSLDTPLTHDRVYVIPPGWFERLEEAPGVPASRTVPVAPIKPCDPPEDATIEQMRDKYISCFQGWHARKRNAEKRAEEKAAKKEL